MVDADITLKTIDAHVGGQAVRLVVAGFPSPHGKSMAAKLDWLTQREDELRQLLMLEPRGHLDLMGALFTESVVPGSHAGVLFMNHAGFSGVPASAVLAAAAVGLTQRLVMPSGDGTRVALDTTIGTVHAAIGPVHGAVSVTGPPAFVLMPGLSVKSGHRRVQVDVAFGGGFFALVDGEAAGVGTDQSFLPSLREVGIEIAAAINDRGDVVHPANELLRGVDGVIFTAPPNDPRSDLRAVLVSSAGTVDRSAGGCAIGALLAVLDALELVEPGRGIHVEGLLNTAMSARAVQRTVVGDRSALQAEVTASAWITGEHTFVLDARDPVGPGVQLSASRIRPTADNRG
jgi:proline racemase